MYSIPKYLKIHTLYDLITIRINLLLIVAYVKNLICINKYIEVQFVK